MELSDRAQWLLEDCPSRSSQLHSCPRRHDDGGRGKRKVKGLSEAQQPLTGANTDLMEDRLGQFTLLYLFYDINVCL
jgi:hypothetical protein